MKEVDILIIGAGLSGLTLGSELLKLQKDFLIIDKSSGVGGRVATRRLSDIPFDHGAIYLKPDPYLLKLYVSLFLSNDLRLDDKGIFTYGGMTRLPKLLAEPLPLRKSVKAERITRNENSWLIECEDSEPIQAKKIALTAPLPQALELLDKSPLNLDIPDTARRIVYSKAVIGLFKTDMDLISTSIDPDIETLCPLSSRISSGKGFIMNMSESWSENHFDFSDKYLQNILIQKFEACFDQRPELSEVQVKRWKYRTPKDVLHQDYLDLSQGLFLIGDAFMFPDVRGSIHSALAASRTLV